MLGAEDFVCEPYSSYGEKTKLTCNNADEVVLLISVVKLFVNITEMFISNMSVNLGCDDARVT